MGHIFLYMCKRSLGKNLCENTYAQSQNVSALDTMNHFSARHLRTHTHTHTHSQTHISPELQGDTHPKPPGYLEKFLLSRTYSKSLYFVVMFLSFFPFFLSFLASFLIMRGDLFPLFCSKTITILEVIKGGPHLTWKNSKQALPSCLFLASGPSCLLPEGCPSLCSPANCSG